MSKIIPSQITPQTTSKAVVTDGSGNVTTSATTSGEIGFLSGVTSAVQTQLNSKLSTGTTVTIAQGGTGQTTASTAFNALSPNTTLGDVTFANGANTNTRLPGNTTSTRNFLVQTGTGSVSAAPTWAVISSSDIPSLSATYVTQTQVGVASGVASLDGTGKIPLSQLPSAIFIYQGTWNPNTNTPTLVDGTGTTGYVYWVSAAKTGTVSGLNNASMINFQIGDLALYNGTQWELTTPAAGVTSVNGSQGAVTVNAINQLTGDVTAGPASGSASAASTIASGAVTLNKMAALAANTLIGNNTGSPTTPIALTQTQATAMINSVTSTLSGAAPASGGGTANFLRADSTWTTPPGTGVTAVTVATANGLAGTTSGGTTPALTLTTTVTGVVKGNGTSLSAASAGTDYVVPSGSITGTAANVTASSNATLTTLSALSLPSSQLTGQVAIANGGTGQSTATAGFDALSPLTTKGDDVVYNGTHNVRFPVGTDYQTIIADAAQTTGRRYSTQYKGPKNYITYSDFENGATTGWSLGTVGTLTNGIPTGTPTFGSGASGNLSISTTTSNPLSGTTSLTYVSSAATTQGNMLASSSYAIDNSDQAKILTFKVNYQAITGSANCNFSGTSSNSFGIAIWDVTNSVWLPSTATFAMTQGSGVGFATGTVQTGATTANLRLVVYNANATAGAVTMGFDDFGVGPQTIPIGAPFTSATAYTPTYSAGWGTVTNSQMFWSRNAERIKIWGSFTAGTVAASLATISLPFGNVDGTKLPSSANSYSIVGSLYSDTSTLNVTKLGVAIVKSGDTVLSFSTSDKAVAQSPFSPANGNGIIAGAQAVNISIELPLTGLSSNVQMSSDTDTRVIATRITGATATITSAYSDVAFTTVQTDLAGDYSSPNITVPVTGIQDFSGQLLISATTIAAGNTVTIGLFNTTLSSTIEETTFVYQGTNTTSVSVPFNFRSISLNSGTQVKIQVKATSTAPVITASTTQNFLSYSRMSGPSVIAASETITASAHISSAASTTAGNAFNFDTVDWDSHAGITTGTTTWNYKVPAPGKYEVEVVIYSSAAAFAAAVYKNGSIYRLAGQSTTSSAASGSVEVICNANDTLMVSPTTTVTPALFGGTTIAASAWISIKKTGN